MFDIIFFAILIYFMWKGYHRGFSRELPRFLALASALIVGIIFYSIIALMINSTSLPKWIGSFTSDDFKERITYNEKLDEVLAEEAENVEKAETEDVKADEKAENKTEAEDENTEGTTEEATEDAESEDKVEAKDEEDEKPVEESNIKPVDKKQDSRESQIAYQNVDEEMQRRTAHSIFGNINSAKDMEHVIGEFIVMYISLIIILIAVYIGLRYFTKKKKLYRKIKIPMQINPALGGVIGVLRCLLVVYIAIAFLVVCEPIMPSTFVLDQIEHSEIIKAMYDKNYIANIVARQDFLSGAM